MEQHAEGCVIHTRTVWRGGKRSAMLDWHNTRLGNPSQDMEGIHEIPQA